MYALRRQHSRCGARRPWCSVRGGVWVWVGGTWASHAVRGVRACGLSGSSPALSTRARRLPSPWSHLVEQFLGKVCQQGVVWETLRI